MDTFYSGCLSFYTFTLPVCKVLTDFRAVFKNYLDDPETATLVEVVVQARAAMATALVTKGQPHESKMSALDQYLNALFTTYESLLAQGGVKVRQSLQFEWVLYQSGTGDVFRSSDMIFELIMLLHVKALLSYYHGRRLLETDIRAFLSEAAKHFLAAASTMDYLVSMLTHAWNKKLHASQPNPLEAQSNYCAAQGLYYRSCALICAALKALENSQASPLVRARVTVAAVNSLTQALASWQELRLPPRPAVIQVTAIRDLMQGHLFRQLALDSIQKERVGEGLGAYQRALEYLRSCSSAPPTPATQTVASAALWLKRQIEEEYAVKEKENRCVYFQSVMVPALPVEAVVLTAPPAFHPVLGPRVVFKPNAPKSFFSSIFGQSKDTKGAASAKEEKGKGEGASGEKQEAEEEVLVGGAADSFPVYMGLKQEQNQQPSPSAPPGV
eukprot:gene7938-8757_t